MASTRTFIRGLGVAGFCAVLVPLGACALTTTGSGDVVTRSITVPSFSRIEVSSNFDVNVSAGVSDGVTLRIDDNLLDLVDVAVSGGTLRIGLAPDASVREATLHAEVMARALSSIDASGTARLHLSNGFPADVISFTLSGSSWVDGEVAAKSVDIRLSGASLADLTGTITDLVVRADGGSVLTADGLQVRDLEVDLSGGTRASVSVDETIAAELSGGSTLWYRGSPTFVSRDVSGGSSITEG